LLFLLLMSTGTFAQPLEQAPIFTRTLKPLPPTTGPQPTGPPEEVPRPLPVEPEIWDALKEQALTAPGVPAPDTVLSPAPPSPESSLAGFPGLSYGGSTPSDANLGRSGQRTIQAVNREIRLFDANNNPLQTVSLATFFSPVVKDPFDPKVLFDRNATNQRFYITATDRKEPPLPAARLFLAVSRSPNPSDLNPASWCRYSWTPDDFDPATGVTWADQPNLGVGTDTLVLASNYFKNQAFIDFTYTIVEAFHKIGTLGSRTTRRFVRPSHRRCFGPRRQFAISLCSRYILPSTTTRHPPLPVPRIRFTWSIRR
jgi:hypothetical protein